MKSILRLILLAVMSVGSAHVLAATQFPTADWARGTPESQGVDEAKLVQAVNYLKGKTGRDKVRELMIIRNGVVIWAGNNIHNKHRVWSVTKSFTSTVLGILVDDRRVTLNTPVSHYVPNLSNYTTATLRHFTTMTSGYRAQGDEPRGDYAHGPSRTPFNPASPLFAPGAKTAYWDSAINQLAHVLTRAAGEPLEALFKRRIADPIGMRSNRWSWEEFNGSSATAGLRINGGAGNNSQQIEISVSELARLGLLYLNRGRWAGQPLLSESWVERATSIHVPATLPWHGVGPDPRGAYGYNWWVNGITAHGTRKWPGAPAKTFAASGFNNNDLFVIPEWNMVVARMGLDQDERQVQDAEWGTFLQKIGVAIQSTQPPPPPVGTVSDWLPALLQFLLD